MVWLDCFVTNCYWFGLVRTITEELENTLRVVGGNYANVSLLYSQENIVRLKVNFRNGEKKIVKFNIY